MPQCINLRDRFGHCYRITYDPAYDPKHRPRDKLDPWMMQILCQRGTIYPFDSTRLAIDIDGSNVTANKLQRLDGVEIYRDGEYERTFLFDSEIFDQVAKLVQPRRRRVMSEEWKAAAREHLKTYAFQRRGTGRKTRAPTSANLKDDDSIV